MRYTVLLAGGVALLGAGAVLFSFTFPATSFVSSVSDAAPAAPRGTDSVPAENIQAAALSSASSSAITAAAASTDEPNQSQLSDPPSVVRAMYVTGWVAGIDHRINELMDLAQRKNINSFVVDIKDYSGYLAYRSDIPMAAQIGAYDQIRIKRPNALIKRLHERGFYVIGRISVFQDPLLAKGHPEWGVQNKNTGALWHDRKGLSWIDPAASGAHEYISSIAHDAIARGFDEVNFDYIRFPSDGDLEAAYFPFWDQKSPRHVALREFFRYLHESVTGVPISADLFGLATVNKDDMGIGQVLEDALPYFDYVCPMVYPSHYAPGFIGYKNPAAYPYEVIQYSLERAIGRSNTLANVGTKSAAANQASISEQFDGSDAKTENHLAKIRPWLQVFDLGTTYDAPMIQAQTKAVSDVLGAHEDQFVGWLFWDPKNQYRPL